MLLEYYSVVVHHTTRMVDTSWFVLYAKQASRSEAHNHYPCGLVGEPAPLRSQPHILNGTFDVMTRAHRRCAEEAREQLREALESKSKEVDAIRREAEVGVANISAA